MRRILIAILILLSKISLYSQFDYSFQYLSGAYTNLTGATNATTTKWDDQTELTVSLGFNFRFYDFTTNTITIFPSVGSIAFGDYVIMGAGISNILQDRSTNQSLTLSPVSYAIQGSQGNHIAKVQFNNAGFISGVASDSLNLQIWLYEANNAIEVRYGLSSVASEIDAFGGTGPSVILLKPDNSDYFVNELTGLVTSPTLANGIDLPLYHLWGMPTSGDIYHFEPLVSTIQEEIHEPSVSIKPIAVVTNALITSAKQIEQVAVYNMQGQRVYTSMPNAKTSVLDLSQLSSGCYLVALKGDGFNVIRKLFKE